MRTNLLASAVGAWLGVILTWVIAVFWWNNLPLNIFALLMMIGVAFGAIKALLMTFVFFGSLFSSEGS